MSNAAILWLCLIAMAVCIAVSFKWNYNMGLLSMAAAFLIGCLVQGEGAATIYGYWPDNLIFFIIASNLFFGYARENGTLNVFGRKILWRFRNNIKYVPFLFFFVAALMGFLGAGPGTIVLVAPIAFAIGAEVGIDPLLMVFAVDSGYNCGTQNPWTGTGVILYGLVENSGVSAAEAFTTYFSSYVLFILNKIIFLIIVYIFLNYFKKKNNNLLGNQSVEIVTEKPADYTPVQKKTMYLVLTSVCLLVIPSILNTWLKVDNAFFANLVKLCKPQSIMIIFAVIASIMKLADTKKVINRVPMNTVLLIAGVCFLMEIAKKAELLEIMTGLFNGENMPVIMVAPMLCFLAAFLSIFSSGTSVVCPLMFPMVPALTAATGISPYILYAAIQMGALATPISPFSTAGSQFVGLAPDDLKDQLVKRQFVMALVMMVVTTPLAMIYGLF